MVQPDPLEIAQHLHNAADHIALFNNLPAVHEGQTLHNLTNAVARLGLQMEKMETTINGLQTELRDMRREMNDGFTRVEARISAVCILLIFSGESGLISTRSDHNSLARTHNASINNAQLALHILKTPHNVEPAAFPQTSAQLSSWTGKRSSQIECMNYITEFSSSAQYITRCIRSTCQWQRRG